MFYDSWTFGASLSAMQLQVLWLQAGDQVKALSRLPDCQFVLDFYSSVRIELIPRLAQYGDRLTIWKNKPGFFKAEEFGYVIDCRAVLLIFAAVFPGFKIETNTLEQFAWWESVKKTGIGPSAWSKLVLRS